MKVSEGVLNVVWADTVLLAGAVGLRVTALALRSPKATRVIAILG